MVSVALQRIRQFQYFILFAQLRFLSSMKAGSALKMITLLLNEQLLFSISPQLYTSEQKILAVPYFFLRIITGYLKYTSRYSLLLKENFMNVEFVSAFKRLLGLKKKKVMRTISANTLAPLWYMPEALLFSVQTSFLQT